MASAIDQTISQYPDSRPDLLGKDDLLNNRFKAEEKIGQGSFGQIFRGHDLRNKREVAIKIEPSHEGKRTNTFNDPRRLVIEQRVLLLLRHKADFQPNIPMIYASGMTEKGCPYIVMQFLGKNLTVLRKEREEAKFTPSTSFRVAAQVAHGLQSLHEVGYIHRDVKPSNCCTGAPPDTKKIYLVDFGMCRKVTDSNGKWYQSLKNSAFKGTVRYATVNALKTHDCGPRDDLIGWFYSVIEITQSRLPWAKCQVRDMVKMKTTMTSEEICSGMPTPFLQCYNYVDKLKSTQMPKYEFIHECLKRCIPDGVNDDDPYDWEIENI